MDFLEVARIIKPHGLGGEVGVLMHWSGSEVLLGAKSVRLTLVDGSQVEREIKRVRPSGKGYLVKFAGIDNLDAAQSLRGALIAIDRALLPEVAPGETYLSDLIGKTVVGPDAAHVGMVVDIASYPSVDSLVIERPDGSRVELPLVDDWVEPLDKSPDRVVLRSLDGLVG